MKCPSHFKDSNHIFRSCSDVMEGVASRQGFAKFAGLNFDDWM